MSNHDAQVIADQLLREHGFASDGRRLAEIDPDQNAFERKILVNAVGTRR